jgi:hypothetical protein
MKNIDAIFAGLAALVVLAIAIFAVARTDFGGAAAPPPTPDPLNAGGVVIASADDLECQCFNQGFDLAGKDVGVMSSQYRTGFEQCRAVGGASGGDAWTAGWNSRLSAKPFAASCRTWRRSRVARLKG